MTIFETERLTISHLKESNKLDFIELLSDPRIINLIPQPKFSKAEILERFSKNLNIKEPIIGRERTVCGVFEKGKQEMIGLALFLTNNDNDKELGYRFKVHAWNKGYATELSKGIINFYFTTSKITKLTAEVDIANLGSVNVLNKVMNPVKEFFNERDNCTDRRYAILKEDWLAY